MTRGRRDIEDKERSKLREKRKRERKAGIDETPSRNQQGTD